MLAILCMYVRPCARAHTHTLVNARGHADADATLVVCSRPHTCKMYKDALSVGEMDEALEPLGFVRQVRTFEKSAIMIPYLQMPGHSDFSEFLAVLRTEYATRARTQLPVHHDRPAASLDHPIWTAGGQLARHCRRGFLATPSGLYARGTSGLYARGLILHCAADDVGAAWRA